MLTIIGDLITSPKRASDRTDCDVPTFPFEKDIIDNNALAPTCSRRFKSRDIEALSNRLRDCAPYSRIFRTYFRNLFVLNPFLSRITDSVRHSDLRPRSSGETSSGDTLAANPVKLVLLFLILVGRASGRTSVGLTRSFCSFLRSRRRSPPRFSRRP